MPTNRSTRLLLPVSPAEPTIIGTPRRRAASSIVSRSSTCHCRGLEDMSVPSGTGPTSHDPESAQIRSGSRLQPIRKLPALIGAKPRCPFGQTITQRMNGRPAVLGRSGHRGLSSFQSVITNTPPSGELSTGSQCCPHTDRERIPRGSRLPLHTGESR